MCSQGRVAGAYPFMAEVNAVLLKSSKILEVCQCQVAQAVDLCTIRIAAGLVCGDDGEPRGPQVQIVCRQTAKESCNVDASTHREVGAY
jgi:hypothetical protein